MKFSKEVQKMKRNKKQQHKQEAMQGQPDDLAMENAIKIRYGNNWPNTILNLTKRIQGVNQTWMQIMNLIMFHENLRITYAREDQLFVITISYDGEIEQYPISIEEVMRSSQFIEVLVMNKLAESPILRRLSVSQSKLNLPG